MNRIPVCYPLEWPANKQRSTGRALGRYTTGDRRRDVTLAEAQTRVFDALDKFNNQGRGWVIDLDECELRTMIQIRKDRKGFIKGDERNPPDVGTVLKFEIDDKPITIAIDAYTKIEQNIAACAAAVDSLRQLWRVDAGTFLAAASGLAGLPPPIAMANWRGILGFKQDEHPALEQVKTRYRKMASLAHSDKGGNDNTMADINRAYEDAKRELN